MNRKQNNNFKSPNLGPKRRSERLLSKSKKKQIQKPPINKQQKIDEKLPNVKDEEEKIIQLKKRNNKFMNHMKQSVNLNGDSKVRSNLAPPPQISAPFTPSTYPCPDNLSVEIFSKLYNTINRIKCVMQLVEWKKKRENCYSVRLSDGFYRIKVIAVGQAGKLLQKDILKQFYIIEGMLEHQGDGVCLLTHIIQFFQYGLCVGFTESWKHNKFNKNELGSCVIDWQKWQKISHKQNQEKVDKLKQTMTNQCLDNDQTVSQMEKKASTNSHSMRLSISKTESISISSSIRKIQSIDPFNTRNRKNLQIISQKGNKSNFTVTKSQFLQKQIQFVSNKDKKQLLLSSQVSTPEDKNQQNLIKIKNENENQLQESWENFLNDFIIFKKQKNQEIIAQQAVECAQSINRKQQKSKRQILQQLFDEYSDNQQQEYPKSLKGNQKEQNNLLKRVSQIYSPQMTKKRPNFTQIFEIFESSEKKRPQKDPTYKTINQQKQQISLEWISKQLSVIKKQKKFSIFEQLIGDQDNETIFSMNKIHNDVSQNLKINHPPLNQTNQLNLQVLVRQTYFNALQFKQRIFQLKDLVEDKDQDNFKMNRNIQRNDQWWLKLKFLYIQALPGQSNLRHTKQFYHRCIGTSQNNDYLCTLMLSKQLQSIHQIMENSIYLLKNPIIIDNFSQQNNYCEYPQKMYPHWIQVNKLKSQIKIFQSNCLQNYKNNNEEWITKTQTIQIKKDNDVVNIIGYVKSYKQNKLNNNDIKTSSKLILKSNQNSKSKSITIKTHTNNHLLKKNSARIMTLIEIIDPFTNILISITDFINPQLIIQECKPIIILRARVNTYKGQRNLITKPDTMIKIASTLINTRIGLQYTNFYLANQECMRQVLNNVEIELFGFKKCSSIQHLFNMVEDVKVKLEVEIFSAKKCSYLGCKKCAKKVHENKCIKCGIVTKQEIIQKSYLMGLVGDGTSCIRFYMNDDVYLNYVRYLDQVESGKMEVETQYNPWKKSTNRYSLDLKRVEIWCNFQGLNKPLTIQKIRLADLRNKIQRLVKQLQQK